ncbi:AAEL001970-PA [Aedes aegypti]|uniref:AAEL001970-PA n=1 Tax=Aedes aegypti TaxID=7159 RepID=Q17JM2_AEDAE|nr:AAEL001970-PA [Aedes aegypti]
MENPSTSSEIPKRHSLTVSSESESETVKLSDSRSVSPQLPHKAPKKVSFSDELPQESSTFAGTSAPDSTVTQKSESVKLAHGDVNPFVFVLQKNDSYLKNLHQIDPSPSIAKPLTDSDVFPNQRRASTPGPNESETVVDLEPKPSASILKPSDPVPKSVSPFDPISAGLVNDLKTQRDLVDAALVPAGKKKNLADSDKIEKSVLGSGSEMPPPVVSAMELEVKRDKRRWLLISELSAICGEEKHTVDGFKRIFREQVSGIVREGRTMIRK